MATFKNMYTEAREELRADHVVVEHGTLPADELYRPSRRGRATMARSTRRALLKAGRRT